MCGMDLTDDHQHQATGSEVQISCGIQGTAGGQDTLVGFFCLEGSLVLAGSFKEKEAADELCGWLCFPRSLQRLQGEATLIPPQEHGGDTVAAEPCSCFLCCPSTASGAAFARGAACGLGEKEPHPVCHFLVTAAMSVQGEVVLLHRLYRSVGDGLEPVAQASGE